MDLKKIIATVAGKTADMFDEVRRGSNQSNLNGGIAMLKNLADTLSIDEPSSPDRMLKWFEYLHLPDRLQPTSAAFSDLAWQIVQEVEPGPERTVALRKLLEAKDAAVRAVVHPGG